ncbi:PadR family transcriptional regulator [Lentzea sp. NPDC058450]|uniref:PadR family transcriptional regulator n=1 Tax=Lentzea sp. NPDC058450 TaxID=3346505 RepID=UPI0036640F4E
MPGVDASTSWLRGTLELAVAALLVSEDLHGYALVQRLAEQGLGTVRGGALYPVLGRMETAGLVETEWVAGQGGPGRKTYRLTAAGRARLDEEMLLWHDFSSAMDRLLMSARKDTT